MTQRLIDRVTLGRQVRFSLPAGNDSDGAAINNHAGFPRPGGCNPFYQLTVELAGRPDSCTWCLFDIKAIDLVVRERVLPIIQQCVDAGNCWPADWMARAWRTVRSALGLPGSGSGADGLAVEHAVANSGQGRPMEAELVGLILELTPFHRLTCRGEGHMVCLTEQFEFAAAHRLWSASLSESGNSRVFGKCANPGGHGHNYVLEVTVSAAGPTTIVLLEQAVNEMVLSAYDHKNLNEDCPEFAQTAPTVENICRAIWRRLEESSVGQVLRAVRLYETPKTYAECVGEVE